MSLFSNSFPSSHFLHHAYCENLAHPLNPITLSEGKGPLLFLSKLLPLCEFHPLEIMAASLTVHLS